uniref:UPAR/Ly6 domain-containing protein n=2 Tax=Wuchereria bancrofti TaxID=6293 RepID=A0AAF5PWZ5_WUCBA
MKECLTMIIWLITSMTQTAVSVKCAECDFLAHTPISGIRTCPENCYGDVCFIVVNNYYNETLVSGCVNVDMETRTFFRDHAYCYKRKWYTVCGCTTSDRCNSPQAPFSMFTFVTSPFFEDCQFMPKQADRDCNPFQFNITLKEDKSETELLLKEQTEKGEGSNIIEMTTENARIGDPLSVMTTPYPMVSSSTIIGIESVSDKSHSDNRNETIGEFVDEVMRSLLPNTDLQHFMDPEFNQIKGRELFFRMLSSYFSFLFCNLGPEFQKDITSCDVFFPFLILKLFRESIQKNKHKI